MTTHWKFAALVLAAFGLTAMPTLAQQSGTKKPSIFDTPEDSGQSDSAPRKTERSDTKNDGNGSRAESDDNSGDANSGSGAGDDLQSELAELRLQIRELKIELAELRQMVARNSNTSKNNNDQANQGGGGNRNPRNQNQNQNQPASKQEIEDAIKKGEIVLGMSKEQVEQALKKKGITGGLRINSQSMDMGEKREHYTYQGIRGSVWLTFSNGTLTYIHDDTVRFSEEEIEDAMKRGELLLGMTKAQAESSLKKSNSRLSTKRSGTSWDGQPEEVYTFIRNNRALTLKFRQGILARIEDN